MLLDQLPPDTSIYMFAGYGIFALVTVIYLLSLFLRMRNLNRDLATLQGLQAEQPAPMPAKPKPARAKSSKAKQARKKVAKKR